METMDNMDTVNRMDVVEITEKSGRAEPLLNEGISNFESRISTRISTLADVGMLVIRFLTILI
jgi:hypothetical protein